MAVLCSASSLSCLCLILRRHPVASRHVNSFEGDTICHVIYNIGYTEPGQHLPANKRFEGMIYNKVLMFLLFISMHCHIFLYILISEPTEVSFLLLF